MLDLKLIKAFIAVAEERSFTRAADRLGIAQSAASMRLRRLEDVLGFTLVARTSRNVSLTAEGLAFLTHARALVGAEGEAMAAAREIANGRVGSLRIGSYPFLSKERSKYIARYLKAEPGVEVLVTSGPREDLLVDLRAGLVDIVICLSNSETVETDLVVQPLGRLYAHIVLPPEDPLYGLSRLCLSDMEGRQIAIMPETLDRRVLGPFNRQMSAHRLRLIVGPDAEKDAIDTLARARNLPHLAWFARRRTRHFRNGWAVVPFDEETMSIELAAIAVYADATHQSVRFLEVMGLC